MRFSRAGRVALAAAARAIAVCAVCVPFLAVVAAPSTALAHTTHVFDPTLSAAFGFQNGALGTAIDSSDGSIYVSDNNIGAISKFNATGEPAMSFGGGTGLISELGYGPWHLAVDQSSGDFYATSDFGQAVYKYDSSGSPVASFGTGGQIAAHTPIGIGIDPVTGDIYVGNNEKSKVEVFTSSGEPVTKFSTDSVKQPLGVAVDGSGTVYVAGGGFGGPGGIERFSTTGTPEGVIQAGAFDDVYVDPATEDLYVTGGGEVLQLAPGGESLISRFGDGHIGTGWGVSVNETTGEVYVGDYPRSQVVVYGPLLTLSDVTTGAEPVVGHRTAAISAQVDPAGGPAITSCEVEYGTDTSYSLGTVTCATPTPISNPGEVTATLTNLAPLTTYHYRFMTENANGTSFGPDGEFMPAAVNGVETGPATEVTTTGASLEGSFEIDSEGGDSSYYFEYGPTVEYGETSALPPGVDAGATSGAKQVESQIGGLSYYTLYHYRLVATNGLGTNRGADMTFYTLPPLLPSIDSTGSEAVTPTSATLRALVNPSSAATIVSFEYGRSTAYGARTNSSESIGEDSVDHTLSMGIEGLVPGSTYHFRAVAVNFAGPVYGPDQTFDTPAAPSISEAGASSVGAASATLSAVIKPGFSPTSYHFEYGLTSAYGGMTPESAVGSDDAEHPVSQAVGGLAAGTTYHFRVVATNGVGPVAGSDETFVTAPAPVSAVTPEVKCKRGRVKRHGKCRRAPHRAKGHRHHRGGGGHG